MTNESLVDRLAACAGPGGAHTRTPQGSPGRSGVPWAFYGPDLYVYLSGDPAPRSTDQLHASGAFEVGQFKGNVGGQNYDLPTDLDLSGFRSVVVYCRRFTTVFSTAEPGP